jgi:hypothetical protein
MANRKRHSAKPALPHIVAVCVIILIALAPAQAHHSFSAEFDAAKPVSVTGIVTAVEWTNPHAHIQLSVKAADGTVTGWTVELGNPNALVRRGWQRSALKAGDTITINGYRAKDGSRLAKAQSVMMSDGRTVFAGSSLDSASAPAK